MKVTAMMAIRMPIMMLEVRGSPNMRVPIRMAVMGSKTPRTEAFVAPILRLAMASEAVETMVGRRARPKRLSHAAGWSMPVVIETLENNIFAKKRMAPTERE